MGRQPFRRSKSDGTLDDGTGGGGTNDLRVLETTTDFYAHSVLPYGAGGYQQSSATWAPHVLYYPFISYASGTIDQLGIRNNTSLTNSIEVGVYSDSNGQPDTLLGKLSFSTSITGAIYQSSWSGGTPTLVKDTQYWIGWTRTSQSNAPNVYILNIGYLGSTFGGQPSASSTGSSNMMKSQSYSSSLPSTASLAGGNFHFYWSPGRLQVLVRMD